MEWGLPSYSRNAPVKKGSNGFPSGLQESLDPGGWVPVRRDALMMSGCPLPISLRIFRSFVYNWF